uniref:Major facilitator superfamily (MFS) profile domain-containing protein n=1 Tax=Romanomermis culicivorax TaxID=13658 RepID=A0A915JZB6_ROMCU
MYVYAAASDTESVEKYFPTRNSVYLLIFPMYKNNEKCTSQAMNHLKKRSPLKLTLTITVLAVAFGTNVGIYNVPVVNNLKQVIVDHINQTRPMKWLFGDIRNASRLNAPNIFALFVGSFTAGSAGGTLLSPALAENFGRKPGLLISAVLNAIGCLMCFFYLHCFELVFIGRLLMGFSLGIGMPMASAFITEISPVNRRGQLNALLQTAFAVGDIIGMVASTPQLLGSLSLSPYALSLTIIFSAIQFVVMCYAYESPRFLILKQNQIDAGIEALKYFQGYSFFVFLVDCRIHRFDVLSDENYCEKILRDIRAEKKVSDQINSVDQRAVYGNCCLYCREKPLRLACLLLGNCPLVGIPLVMTYSTDAYLSNHVLPRSAQWCTVALGVGNLGSSLLAVGLMDSWGRRPLLVAGLVGCFSSITVYTVVSWILTHNPAISSDYAYILVVCLLVFIVFYSLYGAAAATLAAEICPQTYRSTALSLGVFSNMFLSTVLLLIYEPIKEYVGHPWVFFPSSVVSILIGAYLWAMVPETK